MVKHGLCKEYNEHGKLENEFENEEKVETF